MALWMEVQAGHWIAWGLRSQQQQQAACLHLWPSSFAAPLPLSQMMGSTSVQTKAARL